MKPPFPSVTLVGVAAAPLGGERERLVTGSYAARQTVIDPLSLGALRFRGCRYWFAAVGLLALTLPYVGAVAAFGQPAYRAPVKGLPLVAAPVFAFPQLRVPKLRAP